MNTKLKSKNKLLKTILCSFTAFVLLIIANAGLLSQMDFNFSVFAATSGRSNITDNYLSNPNFNSNTSTTYLFDPDDYTPTIDTDTATVKAGVAKLDDEGCDYYGYTTNSSDEQYVLVIDSNGNHTTYGFVTDDEITLSAGSNYEITIDVLTNNNSGIANLYLYQDNAVYSSLTGISSKNVWSTYHFFIKTSDVEDVTLTLGLFLNGNGVAMFDNITIYELTDTLYASDMSNSTGYYTYVDEEANLVSTTAVNASVFTLSSDDSIYTVTETNKTAYDGSTWSALKIYSDSDAYGTLSTADDFFTFNQNTIYKVTINLKAVYLDGEISLQLIETGLDEGEEGTDSTAISITADTSSEIYNNYTKYSFYINAYPTKSTTYKLVLSYGSDEEDTSGTVYISTITVKKVNYSTFTNVSTGTYNQTIDLTADYVQTNDDNSYMLDNGNFNALEITSANTPYPATATDWTVTTGETDDQQYGIINTSDAEFDKIESDNFSNLTNPGDPDGTLGEDGGNNILMMYNHTADTLAYTSNSVSLDAESYHKFTLQVKTQHATLTVALVTTDSNSDELTLTTLALSSESSWSTVNLYIYTGYQDIDVSLKLILETDSYGYAYVDNTTLDYVLAPTESTFSSITASATVAKIDLSNLVIATDSSTQFSSTDFYTGEGSTNVVSGVVDVTGNLGNVFSNADSSVFKTIANDGGSQYVLAIRSLDDNNYYTLTSRLGYTLEADSYYKISVSVYTRFLVNLPDDADLADYGVTISLSDFDDAFTGIVSNDTWTTYTFYICPSDDVTTYLTLALASETAGVASDAYFGNITFETIEEADFSSATATKTSLVLSEVSADEEDEDTDEETEESSTELATILYYASTIIFAVAIIIAVVGVLVRRVHWKKPKKKAKTAYDRNKTVSRQYYERKATALREKKVREINKEIAELTAQRTQYEETYKNDLTKLRELKIQRADKAEIAKLEKDMKKNQKTASSIGMNISRLESDLEYVKSEAYFMNLSKKIANDSNALSELENDADELVTENSEEVAESMSQSSSDINPEAETEEISDNGESENQDKDK